MPPAGRPTAARSRRTGACRGPAAPERPAGAARRPDRWPAVDAREVAAALGHQIGAVAALEFAQCGDDVLAKRATVAPVQRVGAMRGDVLGGGVEAVGDIPVRAVAGHVRPVRGEDVVGASAQHQIVWAREHPAHRVVFFAHVRPHPAAVEEAAAGVLLRAARRLHHAVQADHGGNDERSHGGSPGRAECLPVFSRRMTGRKIDIGDRIFSKPPGRSRARPWGR